MPRDVNLFSTYWHRVACRQHAVCITGRHTTSAGRTAGSRASVDGQSVLDIVLIRSSGQTGVLTPAAVLDPCITQGLAFRSAWSPFTIHLIPFARTGRRGCSVFWVGPASIEASSGLEGARWLPARQHPPACCRVDRTGWESTACRPAALSRRAVSAENLWAVVLL